MEPDHGVSIRFGAGGRFRLELIAAHQPVWQFLSALAREVVSDLRYGSMIHDVLLFLSALAREVVSDDPDPRTGGYGKFLSALAREVVSDRALDVKLSPLAFLSALAREVVSDFVALFTTGSVVQFLSALAREVVSDSWSRSAGISCGSAFLSALAREVVSDVPAAAGRFALPVSIRFGAGGRFRPRPSE